MDAERASKREELVQDTERGLAEIAERVQRGTLQGADEIGLAVGMALKHYKVKKHFEVQITDTTFAYQRKTEQIDTEAALDGIYVLRTSVPASELATGEVVRSYKNLEQVERAFKTIKRSSSTNPRANISIPSAGAPSAEDGCRRSMARRNEAMARSTSLVAGSNALSESAISCRATSRARSAPQPASSAAVTWSGPGLCACG